jgi:Predicted Fe-S oxidoreductases
MNKLIRLLKIIELIKNKKIIMFGTGNMAKVLTDFLPVSVEYYVDNDEKKIDLLFCEKVIKNVSELKKEKKENTLVIIANSYYNEVSEQLEEIGLEEEINYVNGAFIYSLYIQNKEEMQRMHYSKDQLIFKAYKKLIDEKKRANELANDDEYKKQELVLKSYPTTYVLGLTNICNLKCPLCITGMGKQLKDKKFMDYDMVKNIVSKIKDYAIWVELYKWGESLLHKDFINILYLMKENNLLTRISTNLNIDYNKELFYGLVEAPLHHMIVSLDGMTQETYSKYRIGGNLEKVKENLRILKEIKQEKNSLYPIIDLQFLVNNHNIHEVKEIEKEFENLGADSWYKTETVLPFGVNDIELARKWLQNEDIKNRNGYFDIDKFMFNKTCAFLYKYLIIEQDGSIPPCCYSTNPKDDFGNINDYNNILELYNNDKFVEGRKLFKMEDYAKVHNLICSSCSAYKCFREK